MKKAAKVLLALAGIAGAGAAGYAAVNHYRNGNDKCRLVTEEDDSFEDEEDDPVRDDFFDDEGDDGTENKESESPYIPEMGPDGEEVPKTFLFASHMEYLDFADYQIQMRTREMTKRLSSMYSLVSRRNIKAEEKEKRLKEMILPCLDDCRVMSTTSAGVKGVIHDGYSDDYDAYYIFRGEAIDQLREEEEGKNE